MSAGVRLYPDIFYVNGVPIPASYFIAVDNAQYHCLDADTGGLWTPIAPIVVAGAGVWVAGVWTFTATPGFQTPFGSGKRLTHLDNDYVQFEIGYSLQRIVSFARGADASYVWSPTAGQARLVYESNKDGKKTGPLGGPYAGGARIVAELRMHHGSVLNGMNFSFIVGSSHFPQSQPMFRAFFVDAAGNVTNCSTNPAYGGYVGNGFIQTSYSNAGTYYGGGVAQVFGIPVDPGIVVDNTKYCYFVEVIDESGTGALPGNEFLGVVVFFQNIPNLQPD